MFDRSVCRIIKKNWKPTLMAKECSVAYRSGAPTGFLEILKTTSVTIKFLTTDHKK